MSVDGRQFKVPETLPMWFVESAKDARFSAKEVVKIFGFSSHTPISTGMKRGHFPLPVGPNSNLALNGISLRNNFRWSKKSLLDEINRRKEYNKQFKD